MEADLQIFFTKSCIEKYKKSYIIIKKRKLKKGKYMKSKFPMFYLDYEKLWNEAVFVFDTNVILDLLRLPADERETLIKILNELKETNTIWIPYQVGYEYHKHFRKIITENNINSEQAYNTIKTTITDLKESISNYSKSVYPDIKIDNLLKELDNSIESITKIFNTNEKIDYEKTIEQISTIFENIGENYSTEELNTKIEEAEKRFKEQIPPGYQDDDKETNKYGDVLIWFQMMDYAKTNKKNIIFVSRDAKPDWYSKKDKQTIAPRFELLLEFYKETNQYIYIYQEQNFIKKFNSNTKKSKISEEKKEKLLNLVNIPIKDESSEYYDDIPNSQLSNTSLERFINKRKNEIPNYFSDDEEIKTFSTLNSKHNPDDSNMRDHISISINDRHRISLMKSWFRSNYEPRNEFSMTRPIDIYEIFHRKYWRIYPSKLVEMAATQILRETGIHYWVKKDNII